MAEERRFPSLTAIRFNGVTTLTWHPPEDPAARARRQGEGDDFAARMKYAKKRRMVIWQS